MFAMLQPEEVADVKIDFNMEGDRDDKNVKDRKSPEFNGHFNFLTISLYAFGFLDLFAVALIIPVVTKQATFLGGSPAAIGLVGTIYGTLQLISAPLVGRLSDTGGRRQSLLICLFFTSVGYVLMGLSTSVFYYLLARIPLGLFKHSVSITRALLAEITPKEQRAKVFGYFNGISSLGFMIGPLIGGHVAEMEDGFYKVAMVTAGIFACTFVFALLFLGDISSPEGAPPKQQQSAPASMGDLFSSLRATLQTFYQIFRSGPELFLTRFLQGFSSTLFRSNFTLLLEQTFDSSPVITGRIISFGSFVSAICALGVGRLVRLYGNIPRLFLHASILRILALILLTLAPNIPTFLAFYLLLAMGNSVARVCSTNLSIDRGKVQDAGSLLGLNQSLMSVCRSVSPIIAGLSQEVSASGPLVLSVLVSAGSAGIIATTLVESPKKQKKGL